MAEVRWSGQRPFFAAQYRELAEAARDPAGCQALHRYLRRMRFHADEAGCYWSKVIRQYRSASWAARGTAGRGAPPGARPSGLCVRAAGPDLIRQL